MESRYHSRSGTSGSGTSPAELRDVLWTMLRQIPAGKVSTYGALADALGDRKAARAVGSLLSSNPTPPDPPCHRIVYSDGRVGWYLGKGQGADEKEALLRSEGVPIDKGIVDLGSHLFTSFDVPPVLGLLMILQERIASDVVQDGGPLPAIVSALDVSYRGDEAFSARVDFRLEDGVETGHELWRGHAAFPYIPGYLAFREAPVLLPLMKDDGRLHIIDGQGVLHPRGAGIACHLGVGGRRTIGAAKSLLCGVDDEGSIVFNGMVQGRKVGRYYVSVGNLVSLEQAADSLAALLAMGVDPCRRAHQLATDFRKRA